MKVPSPEKLKWFSDIISGIGTNTADNVYPVTVAHQVQLFFFDREFAMATKRGPLPL
jgi:hypothetical protein